MSASINSFHSSTASVELAAMEDWLNTNIRADSTSTQECITQDPEDSQVSVLSAPTFNDVEVEDLLGDSASYASVKSGSRNTKLNRFILTFFPPTKDPTWLHPTSYFANADNMFQCWTGQFEICPTSGSLHAHIYVECLKRNRPRFNTINNKMREFFPCVQIKSAKKSSKKQRQCAINYCVMDSKRAPDTEIYIWDGTKFPIAFDATFQPVAKRGKGEDDEEKRVWIESKPRFWTWEQIVHENDESKKLLFSCSWGKAYHNGRHAEDKRRDIQNVVILYGAGGTGKTTMAHAWDAKEGEFAQERYYRRNPDDGSFWGGGRTAYKGQRIIHYEEFTGQEAFSRLKEVCDIGKPGPSVNIKNGGAVLNHETVLFTSNVHPAGWFNKHWEADPKQFHPFWRRVTGVYFYPAHRPDGELAIPDENNEPYFIDQTAEWKEFVGDYGKCKEHAGVHWPLREEPEPQSMLLNLPQRYSNEPPLYQYCRTGVAPK